MTKHPYTLSNDLTNGNGARYWGEFTQLNAKGERITFELTACSSDVNTRYSLPNLWHRSGMIDRILPSYWVMTTYIEDENGNCTGKYNPQNKFENKGFTINFEWMFEATEENREKLIEELERRAFEE